MTMRKLLNHGSLALHMLGIIDSAHPRPLFLDIKLLTKHSERKTLDISLLHKLPTTTVSMDQLTTPGGPIAMHSSCSL